MSENCTILSVDDPTMALACLREELHRRMEVKWTCENGTLIDIKRMDYSHLCNTIDMLEQIEHEREIISENENDVSDGDSE